jgi:hypothetical protein
VTAQVPALNPPVAEKNEAVKLKRSAPRIIALVPAPSGLDCS